MDSACPNLDLAAVDTLVHGETIGDCLMDQRHMRNQPYGASLTYDALEDLQDLIQCASVVFSVEAAKALVDENRIQPYGSIGHFHDVRKSQSQRQGCNEGFTDRQGNDLAGPASLDVVNPHIETPLRPPTRAPASSLSNLAIASSSSPINSMSGMAER